LAWWKKPVRQKSRNLANVESMRHPLDVHTLPKNVGLDLPFAVYFGLLQFDSF
jgi:hypothetical protein